MPTFVGESINDGTNPRFRGDRVRHGVFGGISHGLQVPVDSIVGRRLIVRSNLKQTRYRLTQRFTLQVSPRLRQRFGSIASKIEDGFRAFQTSNLAIGRTPKRLVLLNGDLRFSNSIEYCVGVKGAIKLTLLGADFDAGRTIEPRVRRFTVFLRVSVPGRTDEECNIVLSAKQPIKPTQMAIGFLRAAPHQSSPVLWPE